MGSFTITIDTGTTYTRTILWDNSRNPVAAQNKPIGVRHTAIEGNNDRLRAAVKECLDALLLDGGIDYSNVGKVIASGMITSNVGLVDIPHVVAPCGVKELAAAVRDILLSDVCPKPIYFIPGVKNFSDNLSLGTLDSMDMMRGEEVETFAIINGFPPGEPMLLVFPGSHTKYVSVDKQSRITGSLSTIGGELLVAITENTIIASAVNRSYACESNYDKAAVLAGYDMAKKTGIGRACFTARILNMFVNKSHEFAANFLMGIILQGDIFSMLSSSVLDVNEQTTIIITGKNPFRQALIDVIHHENSRFNVQSYIPETNVPLSALGVHLIIDAM